MTWTDPWQPLGRAILDHHRGEEDVVVLAHTDEGDLMELPAEIFFRPPERFTPLEHRALELCRGSVLDLGAGAGCHSLELQRRGIAVCAADISADAVEVMRQRGLRDVRCAGPEDLHGERFDTVLLMMHGIGIARTLAGLHGFLSEVQQIVAPGGQILLDSLDLTDVDRPGEAYEGEVGYRLEYLGLVGPPFHWLYVDLETLEEIGRETGWRTHLEHEALDPREAGRFLARLTKIRESPDD